MPKSKKKITEELDPKLLDGKKTPYPCSTCSLNNKPCSYRYCDKWRAWYREKWKEVTGKLRRKE